LVAGVAWPLPSASDLPRATGSCQTQTLHIVLGQIHKGGNVATLMIKPDGPHRYCLSWSALICPEFSGDAKFVRLLDQATDIVTNDFTRDFIDHRDISLAPKVIPELSLDH